jgi:hypothetical protein
MANSTQGGLPCFLLAGSVLADFSSLTSNIWPHSEKCVQLGWTFISQNTCTFLSALPQSLQYFLSFSPKDHQYPLGASQNFPNNLFMRKFATNFLDVQWFCKW